MKIFRFFTLTLQGPQPSPIFIFGRSPLVLRIVFYVLTLRPINTFLLTLSRHKNPYDALCYIDIPFSRKLRLLSLDHNNYYLNQLIFPDMELVSLSPEGGGSIELMATFVNLLRVTLEAHQDFEAVHAYLGLFLKHHSDTIIENDELIEALSELQPVLNQSWTDLKNTLTSAATLVSFAKNSMLASG